MSRLDRRIAFSRLHAISGTATGCPLHVRLRDFGTEQQEELRRLSLEEADDLTAGLEAGSMRPKIEASAEFVRMTGREVLITSPAALAEALEGEAGTLIS